ncbi:iron ABC transporter permease [Leisingera sp. M658]|uniref:FecCD family ABC transporter permease n=1 Tax=Leisingera sp. M658 TaxID=2867015 RepID=UPI0021A612F5|nr:iron ABC transporter permease [Leisingera sp. M658]UWQ75752.1 iron ABC transporter permease [Leisingera sp. M658]
MPDTALALAAPRRRAALSSRALWLTGSLAALILLAAVSLRLGLRPVSWAEVWQAMSAYDPASAEQIVIRQMRLPRLLGAGLTGAALGISGTLIQGLTRNPLADPGLLGINGGAALAVTGCILLLGITDPAGFVWAALGGALAAALLVAVLSGGSLASPLRLLLAGAAISSLFLALTRALLLASQQALDVYRFWVLGGFDGIQLETIAALAPFFVLGALAALAAASGLDALLLGEDSARSLGVRTGAARLLAGTAIVLLSGSAVALAGPIAFAGLIVPHLARWAAGPGLRWSLALSAPFGAILLLGADLAGRLPLFGGSLQAGVMTALLGGPALIWMVRRNGARSL